MRRSSQILLFGLGLGLAAPGCEGVSKQLVCQASTECVRGDSQGQCMPPGFCAFSDGTCPSGFRWDPTAAPDLAGDCVEANAGVDAGAPPDAGQVPNTCGGTTPLAGAPGSSCGICDSGVYQCDGPDAVSCEGELNLDAPITNLGTVEAEKTFNDDPSFGADLAKDNNLATSWFSQGPDGDGTPTFFRWNRGADECISRITFVGNGGHPSFPTGFGFGQVTVRVLDSTGSPVFSQVHDLDANSNVPDPNLDIDTGGVTGRTVEFLFTGHEDPSCGGFAELTVTAVQ